MFKIEVKRVKNYKQPPLPKYPSEQQAPEPSGALLQLVLSLALADSFLTITEIFSFSGGHLAFFFITPYLSQAVWVDAMGESDSKIRPIS